MQCGNPAPWLITGGVVIIAVNLLGLVGNHPAVSKASEKLGMGRAVAWIVAYPTWQSQGMKRFGRIAGMIGGRWVIAWGIYNAIAFTPPTGC